MPLAQRDCDRPRLSSCTWQLSSYKRARARLRELSCRPVQLWGRPVQLWERPVQLRGRPTQLPGWLHMAVSRLFW